MITRGAVERRLGSLLLQSIYGRLHVAFRETNSPHYRLRLVLWAYRAHCFNQWGQSAWLDINQNVRRYPELVLSHVKPGRANHCLSRSARSCLAKDAIVIGRPRWRGREDGTQKVPRSGDEKLWCVEYTNDISDARRLVLLVSEAAGVFTPLPQHLEGEDARRSLEVVHLVTLWTNDQSRNKRHPCRPCRLESTWVVMECVGRHAYPRRS